MKHVILKNQILKIAGVFSLALVIAVWQRQFILDSLNANIIINGTIIGVFALALSMALSYVFGIFDEHRCVESLEEDRRYLSDVNKDAKKAISSNLKKCFELPIMVSKPKILEQASRSVSNEMFNKGKLELTDSTMQIIMDRVDENINKSRQTLNFLGNVLILLGLIGTFIGLMITVGSIGNVLGSIAPTAAGGDVFTEILQSLRGPLEGMATGFSSTLFGLLGALITSLVTQFLSEAHTELRERFESWLSDVANITSSVSAGASATTGSSSEGETTGSASNDKLINKLVSLTEKSIASTSNIAKAVDEFYQGVQSYTELQIDQAKAEKRTADNLMRLTDVCEKMRAELEDVSEGGATIEEVRRLHGLVSTSYEALESQRDNLSKEAEARTQSAVKGKEVQKSVLNADSSIDDTINNLEKELQSLLTAKDMRKKRRAKANKKPDNKKSAKKGNE